LFTISIERTFTASHQLTLPDDSKEPLHSHNWVVVAAVCSEQLDKIGIVMDFEHLKTIVGLAVASLENTQLEETGCFDGMNSSAENVVKYLYEKIDELLPRGVKLKHVRVTETPGCTATYNE
jgi:6-pyruvoyltetrahydropterin/6-carboxytetrahydropterin synthase